MVPRGEPKIMSWSVRKLIKGKKAIGIGKHRNVYALGNGKVIKVAKTKAGMYNNLNEAIVYKSCAYSLRRHLAAIIKHSKHWLIMKRYKRRFPKSKRYAKKLKKLESRFKKYGITPSDITLRSKPIRQNLRLNRKGKIIVIDYGNFRKA